MERRGKSQYVGAQGKITAGNRRSGLRRALVRTMSLCAFLACILAPSLALANNNAGLKTIPLHISNHTNQAANLYILIFGVINRDNGKGFPLKSQVYVTNAQGDVAINPAIPAPGMPLGINVGMGKEIDLMLPKLSGVRIYSSVGQALVTQNGGVIGGPLSPPDVENPGDPNFNTMFDSVELTWEPQKPIAGHPEITTNIGINVTEVDLFGLVQQYTIEGTDPATFQPNAALTGGFLSSARRPALLNMLQGFGPPWSNLIVGSGGARARVISPNHAIHATLPPLSGLFPANQLDSYITQVFQKYTTEQLTTTVNVSACEGCASVTYNFIGINVGGELVFSDPNKNGGEAIFSLAKWSTFNAYEGSFPYGLTHPQSATDILAALAVQAKLQGAMMRTTLLVNTNLDACNTSQFYVNAPVNMYAKLWHQAGINGKAYGFGFDDTCDQSSFKLIFNPTKLTIRFLGNRP
jgi:Beta-1,3-glucanase